MFGFIFGTMFAALIASSGAISIRYFEYILRHNPEFGISYMYPDNMIKCLNCATVGIESIAFAGKHCDKCGVYSSNQYPHTQIAK